MKFVLILISLSFTLLLGGCADQSLISDEDYRAIKGPAPHSPDYSKTLPGYQ